MDQKYTVESKKNDGVFLNRLGKSWYFDCLIEHDGVMVTFTFSEIIEGINDLKLDPNNLKIMPLKNNIEHDDQTKSALKDIKSCIYDLVSIINQANEPKKCYYVRIKGIKSGLNFLNLNLIKNSYFVSTDLETDEVKSVFTSDEIKKAKRNTPWLNWDQVMIEEVNYNE